MHVLFTGNNSMINTTIEHLASCVDVGVFSNEKLPIPSLGKARIIPVKYRSFGMSALMGLFSSETAVPTYVERFEENLSAISPNVIIVLDLHKFVLWQCIQYKKKHPECRLYLYSNTRRWPDNIFIRGVFRLFWSYFKHNISFFEKVLVLTHCGEHFFRKHAPETSVVLCPPGIDTQRFCPGHNRMFMSDGILRVLMNARFVPYKNHRDMFRAMKIVRDRGVRIELSCIGRGGHMEDVLRAEVESLGIAHSVHFLPRADYGVMPDIYRHHDILVLPSYQEELGLVVPEAMACGTPTITSDTVGANVYVRDGETGMIFRTGDVEDLTRCIVEMSQPGRLAQMGKHARTVVEGYLPEKSSRVFLDATKTK